MRITEGDTPGICGDCGMPCYAVEIDQGIGAYEYWGAKGIHHDYQWVSPCCEGEVVEGSAHIVKITQHTAKRDHKNGQVKRGQRYEVTVWRHYRKGGPSWVSFQRRILDGEEA